MKNDAESNNWIRVRSVAAGFLGLMALPIALALANVQSNATVTTITTVAGPAVSESVPSSMHEAQAGSDIGPGSDEALLVSSPTRD